MTKEEALEQAAKHFGVTTDFLTSEDVKFMNYAMDLYAAPLREEIERLKGENEEFTQAYQLRQSEVVNELYQELTRLNAENDGYENQIAALELEIIKLKK